MHLAVRSPGGDASRLLAISGRGTWDEPRPGARADLGEEWWALPGLADAHAHLAADELVLAPGDPTEIRRRAFTCLESGTFLVVDKGWCDDSVLATLASAPPLESPDLEGAGRMIAVEGGYYPGFAIETDPAGLAEVVRSAAERGRGWVKLVGDWPRKGRGAVGNFDEEALALAVDVAHRGGARVAIHTMAPEVPSWAVQAGVDSIEHGPFLSRADLEELARRRGAWVPTVLRLEELGEALGRTSSGGRLIAGALGNLPSLLAEAPPGVAVLAGTDLATPPGAVAREAAALARMGLPPERAVDAASAAVRRYLGRDPGFVLGEAADALFFEVDPYQDPAVLAEPVAVFRSGRRLR
ncbi:MAG: amidohydrolase family protein [Actinomycetota bacterium]